MKNYVNNTRTSAVLTVNIESTEDPKAALEVGEIGNKDVYTLIEANIGYNDLLVGPGKELRIRNNTVMSFVAVRSAV